MANPESPVVSGRKEHCREREDWERGVGSCGEIEVDTFGDWFEKSTEGVVGERGVVTDRFIPARKHFKLGESSEEIEGTHVN